jgi:hypothetical protein
MASCTVHAHTTKCIENHARHFLKLAKVKNDQSQSSPNDSFEFALVVAYDAKGLAFIISLVLNLQNCDMDASD